tara:strand:- start:83 stop:289 length:207 start_codon:yes stop_codon:yes gene_type:complete
MENQTKYDTLTLQKMSFIYNAIQTGWTVKRVDDKYIFSKKHEGKKDVYSENYLKSFVRNNLDFYKLIQ